jgi:hypothetical protein
MRLNHAGLMADVWHALTLLPRSLLLFGVVLTVCDVMLARHATVTGRVAPYVWFSLLWVWFQYRVLRAILVPSGKSRFARYFAAGFVVSAACLVAAVFLLLPGLWLCAMWLLTSPLIVEEERSVFEAMRESRLRTAGHRWFIISICLLLWLQVLLLFCAELILDPDGPTPLWIDASFSLATSFAQLSVTLFAAVLHRRLDPVADPT